MDEQLPPAAHETVDGFWDLYSRFYDAVYQLMPYRKLLWDTFQALDLADGMRVLDAGCGTGNLEHFIHTKDCPAVEIDAIDFSSSMLSVARKKCAGLNNVSFMRGDLSKPLPFEDATFDRIVSVNVLYALPDADFTVSELLRVLKPDGVLVLTSPSPEFAVSALVVDHFRRVKNIWGLPRKAKTVTVSMAVFVSSGIAQWALNNFVINRREDAGRYNSLDDRSLNELLERRRADGVARFAVTRALADQNIFATASKVPAAA